ncbi:hypothetical protein HPP92_004121 [Vanilla planifolia]|uniref:Uncharacterized protein n=1 Tax=Vanilla planifolia TaxID=51239 RepID=A0A835S4E4_VANPL|nr:hypothetical protein HPP92_004121 [Vanilla planifolia]
MGSASGSKHPSKPMKKDVVVSCVSPSNPNGEPTPCPNPKPEPDPNLIPAVAGGPETCSTTMSVDGADEDEALALSECLSREEVLRRRSRRLKQLSRSYRRQYWALMEEIRVKHRDYYWEFGKSPVEEDSSAAPLLEWWWGSGVGAYGGGKR